MSKFYDETMQSLLQAVEISKGNISVVQVKGMPAKTYRVPDNNVEGKAIIDTPSCENPLAEVNLA